MRSQPTRAAHHSAFALCAIWAIASLCLAPGAKAQAQLWGMTQAGGTDNLGAIIKYDPVAEVTTAAYSFPNDAPGVRPLYTQLTELNGKLYGMTIYSGGSGVGVLFQFDPATNTNAKLLDFDGASKGAYPTGSLTAFNGKLYGMTSEGGNNGYGVLFQFDPAANAYTKLLDFDGVSKGAKPYGSLTAFNGKLYGMTYQGGTNGYGVVFQFDPAANAYTKLLDFDGASKGAHPFSSLTAFNGKLYGMTTSGGAHGYGVLFQFDLADNTYAKLLDFDGDYSKGAYPHGSLTVFNGKLYGMTTSGGGSGVGVLFQFDPAANIYTKLLDFGGASKGADPFGSLTAFNGKLYGMTQRGGVSGDGVLFQFDPAGNTYAKLLDFDEVSKGASPYGSLTAFNGKLYGMTSFGGTSGVGVLFQFDPAANTYAKLLDFYGASKGADPYGSLTAFNGKLYGMTPGGGTNGHGVLFEFDPAANTYAKLLDFDGVSKGAIPFGSLTAFNGKLYGMTYDGGVNGYGVVFQFDPAVNTYTKLLDFDWASKGAYPYGSLMAFNGKLYGMTNGGGTTGDGVLFQFDPAVNTYTKLLDFDGASKGANPYGSLTAFNGKLYGMTDRGGASGYGVLFQFDPAVNTYTKLLDFDWASTGGSPYGSLMAFNGKLYGMTTGGGTNGYGVLFQFDPAANTYAKLLDFDDASKGAYPYGSLTAYNGKLYGMTSFGGISGQGVLFQFDPSTNTFFKKTDFTGANGRSPQFSSLIAFPSCTAPNLALAVSPAICPSESLDLATLAITDANNTNGALTWHSGTPATNLNQLPSNTVSPTATTTYYVRSLTADGCSDELAVTVTVKPITDLQSVLYPWYPTTICPGGSYPFNAMGITGGGALQDVSMHSGTPPSNSNLIGYMSAISFEVFPTATTTYYFQLIPASAAECPAVNAHTITVLPINPEVCNGLDDDCDGQVDEGVSTTFYADTDGDGYGDADAAASFPTCTPPTGYAANATDCDDTNDAIHPGAAEICNGVDDDCNPATVDPSAADAGWNPVGAGITLLDHATVTAQIEDAAGNLYVGAYGPTGGLIVKWDGSAWTTLLSGIDGSVDAMALDASGNLYVGGAFSTFAGIPKVDVAKWDGSNWSAISTTTGSQHGIITMAFDAAGNLYVGGYFSRMNGVIASRIAKWNGSTWSSLAGGLNSTVSCMAFDAAGNLIVGGAFQQTIGGTPVNGIGRWDGTAWTNLGAAFEPGGSAHVESLATTPSGDIFAFGEFIFLGGGGYFTMLRWNGSTWIPVPAITDPDSYVFKIASNASGEVFAGGSFISIGGIPANHIAKWNGSTWSALGTGTDANVNLLTVSAAGNLYASGWRISSAGGTAVSGLAKWNGSTWSGFDPILVPGALNTMKTDASNHLYVAGQFRSINGVSARNIARWDGSNWTALGSGVDGYVQAMLPDNAGNLYVGGQFTHIGGVAANNVAKWNGSAWSALGVGLSGEGRCLAFDAAGHLLVGGSFSEAGGVDAQKIARWDGTSWSALGSGLSGEPNSLTVSSTGDVYASGYFNTGPTAMRYIRRWNGSIWSALGTGTNQDVKAVKADGAGNVYATGHFTQAGGVPANRIAKWDGTAWSALGSGLNHLGLALDLDASGNLYAGGVFSTAGGIAANRVAKWNGTAWSALGSGIAGEGVDVLATDATGKVYAGVYLTGPSQYIAYYLPVPLDCASAPVSPALNADVCGTIVTLEWPAVCGATAYEVYFGNTNSPTLVGTTDLTTFDVNPVGTSSYWKIVPKNASGNATGCPTWSFICSDADGDGYSVATGDCNDANAAIYPNAPEVCANGIDDDCDGLTDDADPDLVDGVKPLILCPANQTVAANPTCEATLGAWSLISKSDNCTASGSISENQSPVASTLLSGHNDVETVTIVADDGNSNIETCSFTVTLKDVTPPTLNCPPIVKSTDANQCTAIVTYSVTALDNCAGATAIRTGGLASGSTFPTGIHNISWEATDGTGLTATCSFTVTVNDGQIPSIVCPANVTVNAAANQCSAPATYSDPTYSDNCPGATLIQVSGLASGSTFPAGIHMVNWKAIDAANNEAICGFTITVKDGQIPSLTCPANMIKSTDLNQCGAIVTYLTPLYADNCKGGGAVLLSGLASGVFFPKGATTVTWKATDAGGLTKTCSFSVTINDAQKPTITCPGNLAKPTDPGICRAVVTYPTPTATDNCPGVISVAIMSGLPSGASFNKGTTTVIWKATDGAGLTKTCTFRVTVNDTQKPTITCPANQTRNTALNTCSATIIYTTPTFTDNCTGGNVTRISGLASGMAFPKGTNNVVWKATDAAGNIALCTIVVTVTDAQLPTITCPPNISVNNALNQCNAIVNYALPSFSDNCPNVTRLLMSGFASGSLVPVGTQTVEWKATDEGGLTKTCAFTVTVKDTELPSISCPANRTVNGGIPPCTYPSASLPSATAMDNCSIASLTSNAVPNLPPAIHTIIWTATDPAFNAKTCSYTVRVECTPGPPGMAVGDPTHAGDPVDHLLALSLAPNPTATIVTITMEGIGENGGTLLVFDALGRMIWQRALVPGERNVDLDVRGRDFPTGVYQVSLRTANGTATKGLVVSKL